MQGSEASTLQVGPWSNSWPTMPPLVCSNWQDPGSHWSAHIADTVALELKWPLPWIFSLQELFELVILLEPHVCVSLEPTQVVVRDCQSNEKSTWVSFHARESIGSDTFFWRYCTFCNHQIFPDFGPNARKCLPPRIWYSATARHKQYCCHMICFFLRVFGSDIWVHHNSLGILFLELWPKALR